MKEQKEREKRKGKVKKEKIRENGEKEKEEKKRKEEERCLLQGCPENIKEVFRRANLHAKWVIEIRKNKIEREGGRRV